jgi:hypothetical protein
MLQFEIKPEKKDYRNLFFYQAFLIPFIIFFFLVALLNLIFAYRYFIVLKPFYSAPPVAGMVFGLIFLLVIPFTFIMQYKEIFSSNKSLQETIKYEFSEDQVLILGTNFYANYKWDKFYKVEELKHWLLFYQDNTRALFLFKPQMDPEDLKKLKELIIKKNIKRKLFK